MSAVAFVQVASKVRRPVSSDTFVAREVHEDGQVVRMRGHWRDSDEERSYTLPLRSIVAIRWTRELETVA